MDVNSQGGQNGKEREPRKVRGNVPEEVATLLEALGLSGAGVVAVVGGKQIKGGAGLTDDDGDDEPCDCATCTLARAGELDISGKQFKEGVRVISPATMAAIKGGGESTPSGEFKFNQTEIDVASLMFEETADVFSGTLLGLLWVNKFKPEHAACREVFFARLSAAFGREMAAINMILDTAAWRDVMARFTAYDAVLKVRAKRAGREDGGQASQGA